MFLNEYDYQIGDGVEIAIHAIPALINEYPEEEDNFIAAMVLVLLDRTPIGAYKRVCDYSIESIRRSKLWTLSPSTAQKILLGFISLKPIYNKVYKKVKEEAGYYERISKTNLFAELERETFDFSFDKTVFNIDTVTSLDIYDLEIIYQLIPSDTRDVIHLKIYQDTIPLLASKLFKDRRSYKKQNSDGDIYTERRNIFIRIAEFILYREKIDINIYLKPLISQFQVNDETTSFINEIIFAEDRLSRYEQFWEMWNSIYTKFLELAQNSHDYYLTDMTISYLLAWPYWKENIEEWRSLKKNDMTFYKNLAQQLGNVPAVLYSISKVVNSIGSKFEDEGVEIIFSLVDNNRYLDLGKLQSNTEYYLEIFMRKFIFKYRKQIKKEVRLRHKVIPILDFMIERGSVQGYLLRENIL